MKPLSHGHDSNAPLIEKIKDYLSKDAERALKYEVWIDTSGIKRFHEHRAACGIALRYERELSFWRNMICFWGQGS